MKQWWKRVTLEFWFSFIAPTPPQMKPGRWRRLRKTIFTFRSEIHLP